MSGDITYTPASANTGDPIVHTFSYTMADGHGGQSSAMVSVTGGAEAGLAAVHGRSLR